MRLLPLTGAGLPEHAVTPVRAREQGRALGRAEA